VSLKVGHLTLVGLFVVGRCGGAGGNGPPVILIPCCCCLAFRCFRRYQIPRCSAPTILYDSLGRFPRVRVAKRAGIPNHPYAFPGGPSGGLFDGSGVCLCFCPSPPFTLAEPLRLSSGRAPCSRSGSYGPRRLISRVGARWIPKSAPLRVGVSIGAALVRFYAVTFRAIDAETLLRLLNRLALSDQAPRASGGSFGPAAQGARSGVPFLISSCISRCTCPEGVGKTVPKGQRETPRSRQTIRGMTDISEQ
jgi:hypothetical protein